jgi:hypothetical protein
LAAELWQVNCSIIPRAAVYRSRTSEQLQRFRSLFLALGLLAFACLNPKTDDLPATDNDDPTGVGNPPATPGAAGSAGTGSYNGGAGAPQSGGSGGAGGAAGAGGENAEIPDAGVPDDAGSLADDSALRPDGGDAGTQ